MSELKISPELLQISPEVQDALKNKKPVVALESTIISHGMPFPQNAQTAIEVEETIRKQGAVPATIAIIGGVMKVGLSKEEIELLGREGHNVTGNDSNLLIVFYVQIMPDDFVMQLHRF